MRGRFGFCLGSLGNVFAGRFDVPHVGRSDAGSPFALGPEGLPKPVKPLSLCLLRIDCDRSHVFARIRRTVPRGV